MYKQANKWEMGEDEEKNFMLVKIKKHILKVHIHCQGCEQKVGKLVGKIEGVYKVKIERDLQKVSVWGNVECTTLINKLVKSGKHAELWRAPSPSPSYKWVDDDDDDNDDDEWESYLNRHHMEKNMNMDEGKDDILMNFPAHFPQENIVTSQSPYEETSLPHYNAIPQFNINQSSYLGFPVPLHNQPMMMYNMHAPWYNHHPYSMMYHQSHNN